MAPSTPATTTTERRREQNRLAQRRYRQRQQQQQQTAPVYVHPAPPLSVPVLPAPSQSSEAISVSVPTPPTPQQPDSGSGGSRSGSSAPSVPRAVPLEPPSSAITYASPTVGAPKTFCDLIADGANLLLDGLGTIDMADIELPSSFTANRQPGSSRPSPTPAEVVEALGQSIVYTRASSSSMVTDAADRPSSMEREDRNVDAEKARKGWATPLHMAARKGQDKIVRTLLQHNADCNLRDGDGLTPLLRATVAGHREIVSLLLSHGARIDLTDSQHRSALHWAVAHKQEAILRVLLENGGNRPPIINQYDNSGMTPLHIAVDQGFDAAVQLLLHFGASVHC